MKKKANGNPSLARRLWAKIVDRALGTVVIALFAAAGLALTIFWEAITDGRVVEQLGGAASTAHIELAARVDALEKHQNGGAINKTVAEWLEHEDWNSGNDSEPDQRLALFERDVGALAGRVEIAPQLCKGIEYTVRFCITDDFCPPPSPDKAYIVLADGRHFNQQAANPLNWIIAASSEWQGGTLFDQNGSALDEKGSVEIVLNKNGPGRLSAHFKPPPGAERGSADFNLKHIYVDQAFDGVRQPCSTTVDGS